MKTREQRIQEAIDQREIVELAFQEMINDAIQEFLIKTRDEVLKSLRVGPQDFTLVAAGSFPAGSVDPNEQLVSLGQMLGWWTDSIDTNVTSMISMRIGTILTSNGSGRMIETLPGFAQYVSTVRDRLVQGISPTLPELAFNKIRNQLAISAVVGSSRAQLSESIAMELGWDKDRSFWKGQVDLTNARIDEILDKLGPPGHPAREAAKLNDPQVKAYLERRNNAIRQLDSSKSMWQVRANRIARTEATGAYNYSALAAITEEEWEFKEWIAINNFQTRETHLRANGQIVKTWNPFNVGGYSLQFPGDPNGPAGEVVNCRCSVIGSDGPANMDTVSQMEITPPTTPKEQPATAGQAPTPTRRPRVRRAPEASQPSEKTPKTPAKPRAPRQPKKDSYLKQYVDNPSFTIGPNGIEEIRKIVEDGFAGTPITSVKLFSSNGKKGPRGFSQSMTFELFDADGNHAGKLMRGLYPAERMVDNSYFLLRDDLQGEGYGEAMLAKLNQHFKDAGFVKLEIHAALKVGPYAWARQGFQWDPRYVRQSKVEWILDLIIRTKMTTIDPTKRSKIRQEIIDRFEAADKAGRKKAEKMYDELKSSENSKLPTPFDLSNLGNPNFTKAEIKAMTPEEKEYVKSWFARKLLTSNTVDWHGIRDL